jgi:hypothetical protein
MSKNHISIVTMLALCFSVSACADQPCIMSPPADLNGDCVVNLQDFALMASEWLDSSFYWPNPSTLYQYYAQPVVEDRYGVIAPWYKGQNGQLDERIRIAAEVYKRYPWVDSNQAVMAAPHMVYNTHWTITPDGTIGIQANDNWMCGELSNRSLSIIQGLTKYYAYSGDPLAYIYVPLTVDYILDYCLTPANQSWPSFPISVPWNGVPYGRANQNVPIQLDMACMIGTEVARAYKLTGNPRYLDNVKHWADVLAAKCNLTPGQDPWGRYAYPQYAGWSNKLTGGTPIIVEFLDEVISLGYTGSGDGIVQARDAGRAYILNQLLPSWTVNETWGRHYWDWEAAVMTGDVPWDCEYFMAHQDVFTNWRNDVRNIMTLIFNRNGVDRNSFGDAYSGAWAFPESSSCCGSSLSYNQYTYGPTFIIYGLLADDERLKEIGRRMILMATYDSTQTGYVLDGLPGENVAAKDWLNLAQPWPLCQCLKAIGYWPELFAPSRENHIVRTTSVVNSVIYGQGNITYSTFDAPSNCVDVLRISFEPDSITANGGALALRPDLNANGYTLKSVPGGDYIVMIRHDGQTQIVVAGADQQQVADHNAFAYTGEWQAVTRPGALGNSIHITSQPGADMTYSFSGNQVRLIGSIDPNGGIADVYLDGVKQLTLIDCWSPYSKDQQVLYSKSGLSNTTHQFRIVARGAGNLVSSGDNVYVNAVQYSGAAGRAEFGQGGGSTAVQRMIFGYTDRSDFVDSQGNSWRPGTEFVVRAGYNVDSVPASWFSRNAATIANTSDPELYRWGAHYREFWVNLTVGPGIYYVKLLFSDTITNRIQTVKINGNAVLTDFNISQTAGGINTAVDQQFNGIVPKNGLINIHFIGSGGQDAIVKAIEIGPMP